MKKKLILFGLCTLVVLGLQAGSYTISRSSTIPVISGDTVTIADGVELHLNGSIPLTNKAVVILKTENSWLYLDEIRPSVTVNTFLKYIRLGNLSTSIVNRSNGRVEIYKHGSVVIPHSPSIKPLTLYTKQNYEGTSESYPIFTIHTNLGNMAMAARSFKLKKGYMATLATSPDGTGYSKVFIADKADLNVPIMSDDLDQAVSFLRVMQWRYPSQKGLGSGSLSENNLVQSTWCYAWNAEAGEVQDALDVEYVPMRHNPGWPGYNTIKERRYSTHALFYNEPDNSSDDGYSSVEDAVAAYPNMLATGLRIGSPAPTDGGRNWIYSFIDACDKLNYRVDFVALHFYWGGASTSSFYDFCKSVHDRTGRPIWITEWNNGANWSGEAWPAATADQQAKQLNDMTAFFNMLNNASFIERHAVYNWVEDKRAMILNGSLTPAGQMMRAFKAKMAYDANEAFEPLSWQLKAPELLRGVLSSDYKTYTLVCSNPNGGYAKAYLVEKRVNEGSYIQIDSTTEVSQTSLQYLVDFTQPGSISYRMRCVDKQGKYSDYSQAVSFHITPNNPVQLGELLVSNTSWNPLYFGQYFEAQPVMITGAVSFRNLIAFSVRARNLTTKKVDFRFFPYNYTSTTTVNSSESMPFLLIPVGKHDWGGLKVLSGVTKVTGSWKSVSFEEAFDTIPVVFAQQITTVSSTSTAVRIRNVSKTGFEMYLAKETAQTYTTPSETISWMAVAQGEGVFDGRKVIVGRTADNALGINQNKTQLATVKWGAVMTDPLFFASIQTANDSRSAVVRRKSIASTNATIFKQTETSSSSDATPKKEAAGWMVFDNPYRDAISSPEVQPQPTTLNVSVEGDFLYFENPDSNLLSVKIYDLSGTVCMDLQTCGHSIEISSLHKGCYVVSLNNCRTKFIK